MFMSKMRLHPNFAYFLQRRNRYFSLDFISKIFISSQNRNYSAYKKIRDYWPKTVIKIYKPSSKKITAKKSVKAKISEEKYSSTVIDANIKMQSMELRKQVCTKDSNEKHTPSTIVKIYKPVNKDTSTTSDKSNIPDEKTPSETRINDVNIQMLSTCLYKQLFNTDIKNKSSSTVLKQCLLDFEKHGMDITTKCVPDVDFKLPKLEGNNLSEHFKNIGEQQCAPYRDLVNEIIKCEIKKPEYWDFKPGWTRYAPNEKPESVPFPLEDCIIFDVEVCMKAGDMPTLATAVTDKAWYGWVSDSLINGTSKPTGNRHHVLSDLIPLESDAAETGKDLTPNLMMPRVLVGHNVSYDRARIKEQYWLQRTGMRFVDTMSLHICVSGLTSYQRAVLKSGKLEEEDNKWKSYSSLNNLADVYKLYCGAELDKATRDIFVDGNLADVIQNFQVAMNYCSGDVTATHRVLKALFPLFLERFPHPVTFAGMLELGTAYLPVNSNWKRYIDDCEQTFEDLENEAKFLLTRRADNTCQLLHDSKFRDDLWMWDQDWSLQELKIKKTITKSKSKNDTEIVDNKNDELPNIQNANAVLEDDLDEYFKTLENKFKYLMETKQLLPAVKPLLPGYPAWYRKLCTKPGSTSEWIPGPQLISTSMQVTPKLLRLTWEGYPLHYIRGQGWGFLIPFSTNADEVEHIPLEQLIAKCPVMTLKSDKVEGDIGINNLWVDVQENLARKEYYSKKKREKTSGVYNGTGVWCNTILENCCYFMKLPHKDGISHRVGNPLAKDFINKFSENVLAGDDAHTEKVLAIARMLSYWRNNRDRIMKQLVVWLDSSCLPSSINKSFEYGAILPQVVVCGTLTRRAMEPTWMTASNAHVERVGSELRGLVQAPPGYNIVGADVDSQELWIASVIGDSHSCQMHGATPFGWMTLSGSKSSGTDMHSVTAKAVGISRDHAKVINYARIYGAGQNFAERLLKQFNPSMSSNEARSKAMKMFSMTKGKRTYQMKKEYLDDFLDRPYNMWEAMKLAKAHGKTLDEMFHRPKWEGGTESAMFNRLEEIARSPEPVTPFLQCRLTRSLEPGTMPDEKFLPTRINWVVQSGAVDFLHLMLVSMKWLMKDNARFVLSFHDEVRYLVPEQYRYQAALAMHITNLLTRAFCAQCLGLEDLPQSVAFFTSVEVDKVLRKESHIDCKTPSNPHGLKNGYGIPPGESLDIYQTLEKAGGSFIL